MQFLVGVLAVGTLLSGSPIGAALQPVGPSHLASRPIPAATAAPASPIVGGAGAASALGWFNATNRTAPSSRELPAIAYDPLDNVTVLFGGGIGAGDIIYNDTWVFAGGVWTRIHPSVTPPAREGAGLVWDAHDGYLLMFGGIHPSPYSSFLSDTWAFAGGQWRQLSPAQAPSARWVFAMTYDAADQGVLLFGGGNFAPLGDTWLFQNGEWTRLTEAVSPTWRSDSCLVFDPLLNESVLFGGTGNSTSLGDTWAFGGDVWRPVVSPINPPNATDNAMAYDPLLGAVVMTTGGTLVPEPTALTYAFNATGWVNLTGRLGSANVPDTDHQGATWDAWDHYLLAFGGSVAGNITNATWLLDALNVTASMTARENELPFNLSVRANLSGGAGALRTWWNLSLAPAPLTMANGTLAVWGIGAHTLQFTARDAFGATVSVGPFNFTAYAPVSVTASATSLNGTAPLAGTFTGAASGGLAPYAYHWSFGDGSNASGASVRHTFLKAGTFPVTLVATDLYGRTAVQELNVTVHPAPPPSGGAGSSGVLSGPFSVELLAVAGGVVVLVVVAVLWGVRRGRRGGPPTA
ncbi:MAG TPA: PKD domain-containing protein [Thermoplasmata archaeon]|nr:PKD domain-containing protein [Thermoplasmata archaeon]